MSISFACNLFGYSRQVYYRSQKRSRVKREKAKKVVQMIQGVRNVMPRIGGKKLYYLLYESLSELGVGRDKMFSIMRANNLLIKPKRQYHITTNSHHRFRKHKNLIENIQVKRPEQVWVSDITYIGSRRNPQYLSLITDSYSKKIMGYDVSDSLAASGSMRALNMAIKHRKYTKEQLIHHSDRGLQYCSDGYQEILRNSNIKCSMTEQYDPYQNATAERINGILKQEFLLGLKVADLELMTEFIKQSVHIYHQKRPHLSCKMNTPNYMHQQRNIVIKTYKMKSSRELQLSTR